MKYKKFAEKQRKLNDFFNNSIVRDRLPHAFLLEINKSNIIEVIKSIIKKILCVQGKEYCDSCSYCNKINKLKYSDLIFVDGEKETIKKEDILNILDRFSYTALDQSGYKFYIINKIENSNKQALNSLLMFLEEPPKNTYAFITTSNPALVLPTIASRSVYLKPEPSSIDEKVGELLKAGILQNDAELIAEFVDSIEESVSLLESGSFANAYELYRSVAKASTQAERYQHLENVLNLNKQEVKLLVKMLIKLFKEENNIQAINYLFNIQKNYIWNININDWLAGMEF